MIGKLPVIPPPLTGLKLTNEFGLVLALTRAVNAISYVYSTMPQSGTADGTPSETRSRLNMFLFNCAILCEGFKVIHHMKTLFGSNDTFKNGLELLLTDPTTQLIAGNHMKFVRNKGVFHFDGREFKRRASRSRSHPCAFIVGKGKTIPRISLMGMAPATFSIRC